MNGELILSINSITDNRYIDMGWCFGPQSSTSGNQLFDCLNVQFYFSQAEIADNTKPGYSSSFTGYDLFAPELDATHMLPIDLIADHLDQNIESSSSDKSGSWLIDADKSYKECNSGTLSNCIFSASFARRVGS